MKITECNGASYISRNGRNLDLYVLTKNYTMKSAIANYQERFGTEPKKAWLWNNFFYVEIPKEQT